MLPYICIVNEKQEVLMRVLTEGKVLAEYRVYKLHKKIRVMKKGKIFTNCFFTIWTLSVILSFVSCSADGDSYSVEDSQVPLNVETPFSVILKAYSENQDITSRGDVKSTTLYVFDENNDFYKQITVDRDYLLQVKPVGFLYLLLVPQFLFHFFPLVDEGYSNTEAIHKVLEERKARNS